MNCSEKFALTSVVLRLSRLTMAGGSPSTKVVERASIMSRKVAKVAQLVALRTAAGMGWVSSRQYFEMMAWRIR